MVTMRLLGLVLVAACLVVLPASAQAATPGLIASYGFEESSGASAVDSSGSANTGTLAGPTRSTAGRFGGSLSFDGVNDVVNVNDAASLDLSTAMTLEAWVNPSQSSGSWRTVVIKEKPSALAYALYAGEDSGKPSAHVSTNNREFDTRGPANTALNVWTHLAATYDRATLRLYVNGTQVASRAVSGSLDVTTSPLRIGGNTVWGEYFKGLIDEVRVYNRALTAGEIQADMNTPIVDADTQPPSVPAGVTATAEGDDVGVEWQASTDDVGVAGYRVYRDGELIATTTFLGRADADRPVGTYRYRVLAFDAAGNESALSAEATATVAPDTTPPTITIENPPEGAVLKSVNTTARASGSDDIVSVQYKLNGSSVGAPTTGYPWLRALDVRWDFPDGPYELTAEARDAAGNVGVSPPVNVTVANGAPASAQFTAPADGATVSGIVNVEADIAGGIVTDVIFRVDGTRVRQENAQPHFTYAWDSSTVPPGTHTLRVEAADDHFVPLAYDEITVTVEREPDTTPPQVTITSPVNGSVLRDDTYVTGTFDDDSDEPGTVQLKLDGQNVHTPLTAVYGSWYRSVYWTEFPDGPHVLTAEARDAAGNVGTSPPVNVVIENGVMRVDITSPDEGATVSGVATLAVTAGSPLIVEYLYKVDGTTLDYGPNAFGWDTTRFANGVHTVRVEGLDIRRSVKASDTITVVVDNPPPPSPPDPPTIALEGVTDGATVRGSVALTATSSGPPIVKTTFLYDESTYFRSDYAAPYTATWNTTNLSEGPHTLRVKAYDQDGSEVATHRVTVTVDNVYNPPTASFTGIADGATLTGAVTLDAIASGDGVAGVRLKVDGVQVGATDTDAPFRFTWDSRTISDGPHSLRVEAVDSGGSSLASDEVDIVVSNPSAAAGRIAAYGFEEASGATVTDSSPSGNTGTISGATRTAAGKFGAALSFDGVNDSVSIPGAGSLNLTTRMTLAAWVKPTAISGSWRTVLLKERTGGLTYALYAGGDVPRPSVNVRAGGPEVNAIGPSQLPLNTWSHLAATYDSIALRLYVNGTQVATAPLTSPILSSTGALKIGGNAVWGEWFKGAIDEVRVYDRALSAAEIVADRDTAVG